MDEISKQIQEMAEKMEKSSVSPADQLFFVIKSLGAKGLKEKLATLSDDEKKVLKAALEEMTLQKAVSFDDAYAAKMIQGNVMDTIIQEDIASDDADEKLVKPAAAKMSHQGTPTDGWEGQVIKASEMTDEQVETMTKGFESLTSEYDDNFEKAYEGFEKLKGKLSNEKGVSDPAGLAAAIGRKKYGKGKFQHAAAEGKKMKKSELEFMESNLEEIVSKAMDKCSDDKMVMKKLKEKGMEEGKVQGALEKYKMKKDMKKSEDLEKGKMKEREQAKEKIMSMEEKEHGTKDPKKVVAAEKKEHMKKSDEEIEKAKMNKEEDQVGDAPNLEGGKQMAKKSPAPNIEDNAKANKKNMTKSVAWDDSQRLLKANTQGRNFHFNVENFINETLKQEVPAPEIKKAEKEDINDLIQKGMDRNWDQVNAERRNAAHKTSGKLVKSFSDEELAQAMGITIEEAKKILG